MEVLKLPPLDVAENPANVIQQPALSAVPSEANGRGSNEICWCCELVYTLGNICSWE
jgi:hypothetical protein